LNSARHLTGIIPTTAPTSYYLRIGARRANALHCLDLHFSSAAILHQRLLHLCDEVCRLTDVACESPVINDETATSRNSSDAQIGGFDCKRPDEPSLHQRSLME
jgi:hypothetical protein